MRPIINRRLVLCKFLTSFILFAGCASVPKKPSTKPTPRPIYGELTVLESASLLEKSRKSYLTDRSYLADEGAGHYLLAGRYVWIFYDDYMIIKSASEETRIPYAQYKPPGECIQPMLRKCSPPCASGLDGNLIIIPTDCVPRTIFGRRVGDFGHPTPTGRRKWKKNGLPGFWVLADRVVVTLGDMQYYYKYDGTFIERKKNEPDWARKIGPYAKHEWKVERNEGQITKVHFKDLVFDAVSVRFAGPWVAIHQKSKNGYYILVDRTTGEVEAKYESTNMVLRVDRAGEGFYIDKSVTKKGTKRRTTPWMWYGETVVDLQDEDPQKYCYAFKGKKKCVLTPKMAPENRCLPNRKCVPRPQSVKISNLIETDDFIVKSFPGGIEITYDKKNYYTKTHHFSDTRFKRHLTSYLWYRKNRIRYEKKILRRKNW